MEIFGYQFMQNALLAAFLGGAACGIIGVFVVLLRLPLIGVAMAHAAFAGALLGVWLGFNPLAGALLFSFVAAAVIGPLADRGQLGPEASLGAVFSLTLGLAFLFLGLMPGTKSSALELLWGNILTVTRGDILVLAVVALLVAGLLLLFYKEVQATLFSRRIALAVGLPATLVFYGALFLTGATVTASLSSIGGLLVFSLVLNPAAAAYQLTYSLKRLFLLAGLFGVLAGWAGLALSYMFNLPSGATIVLTSSAIFIIAFIFHRSAKPAAGAREGGRQRVSREYFNRMAAVWDETAAERDSAKLVALARRLAIMPGSDLLDIGTGTGVFLPYLAAAIGETGRIVALDFASEMLAIARKKLRRDNIACVLADVKLIPARAGVFDAAVCYSSFPHFDKTGALAEIYRVLRPGGRLAICHSSSRAAINHIHSRIPAVSADTIPDADSMRTLLANAGFAAVSVTDGADFYLACARKPAESA